MKNKIKYLIGGIVLSVAVIVYLLVSPNNKVLKDQKTEKSKNNSIIGMMLETGAGTGEYTLSPDSSFPTSGYVFNAEKSGCENGSTLTYDETNKKVVLQASISDKCYVYFDIVDNSLVKYIKNKYENEVDSSIFLHNGSYKATATEVALNNNITLDDILDANDGSYRYYGANPNNWVCFGMDDMTGNYASEWCDNEHLYRIIGVFDSTLVDEGGKSTNRKEERVKLIKAYEGTEASLGTASSDTALRNSESSNYHGNENLTESPGYSWGINDDFAFPKNLWTEGPLKNSILDGTYLVKINENQTINWSGKIAMTEWKISGNLIDKIIEQIPAKAYYNEIVSPDAGSNYGDNPITVNTKIGLMYVSDYAFAANPAVGSNWAQKIFSGYNTDNNINNNWLFLGVNEWSITRHSGGNSDSVFNVSYSGGIMPVVASRSYVIARPAFSLNSTVTYSGGSGTKADPIRVS